MSVENAIKTLEALRARCCPFGFVSYKELDDLVHELDGMAPYPKEGLERFVLKTMCIGMGADESEVCSATDDELRIILKEICKLT
jgi:hypothetical protein